MSYLTIFYITLALGLTLADLPKEVTQCHAGDVNCIGKTITEIVRLYPKGNPQFGLNALDSVSLRDVVISRANSNSPIQMNFQFNTLKVEGLENATITKVVGFEEDVNKSKYEVYADIPHLILSGEYETSGKVLLLPINGKGHSEINLIDVKIGSKTKATVERRADGKNYGKITKVKSTMTVGRMHVNLENLFGQKDLSDVMNEMINKNWQEIWLETQDGINTALGQVIKNLIQSVLDKLPYDDFYRKD